MDRNACITTTTICIASSLSARRAWIEISSSLDDIIAGVVALRKESVDRNDTSSTDDLEPSTSLSARRAWIEIIFWICRMFSFACRSPQGERG